MTDKELFKKILNTIYSVNIKLDNWYFCINNKNVKNDYIYSEFWIWDKYLDFEISYSQIIKNDSFILSCINYLWNNPILGKSKWRKPKFYFVNCWILNYEDIEDFSNDFESQLKFAFAFSDYNLFLKSIFWF